MPKSKIGGGRPDCNLTLWIRVYPENREDHVVFSVSPM
jgi:hypothetical protein